MHWKLAVFLTIAAAVFGAEAGYRTSIAQWRTEHEAELKAANGWLSVAGLFWLKPGANTVGADASNAIVLPRGPARAGTFERHGDETTFRGVSGLTATINGKAAGQVVKLKSDADSSPDRLQFGGLTMTVIHRGDRYGIRLRDPNSKSRKEFSGLRWFPIEERYHVTGNFVAYDKPKSIPITNVLGQTEDEPSPGYVEFTVNGQTLRLEPVMDGSELFFIFHDLTAGHETYPAGRFLYTDPPKNGRVDLDFNKAENPPCAFTTYATCPLPPKQNHLAARIEAGEKNYGAH